MIISASRRTDIPSHYGQWLQNRFAEGRVSVRNPMNPSQVRELSLRLEDIDCIVFWTKNAIPFMDTLQWLDEQGYCSYFQYTVTPYGAQIERYLPDKNDILDNFIKLSKSIGMDRMVWRYDPIILAEGMDIAYHAKAFDDMAAKLQGATGQCHFSFVDQYAKNKKAMKALSAKPISCDDMLRIAECMAKSASRRSITLKSCCEAVDLAQFGIQPGSCIDGDRIRRITGKNTIFPRDQNQRPGCGCAQSCDIGAYNTCGNGCLYCYANAGDGARKNLAEPTIR